MYDGYGIGNILDTFTGRSVTGLHFSDARPGAAFRGGTHLAIGDGIVGFAPLVAAWPGKDIYAAP